MTCQHLLGVRPTLPHTMGCEDCENLGWQWVHLRMCLTCGHVGCCDGSPGRHASRHFHETGHAVMASFEPGERWGWCYVDEVMVPLPARFIPYLRQEPAARGA